MRVVTLEEHLTYPDLSATIPQRVRQDAGWYSPQEETKAASAFWERLAEVGDERLSAMDDAGIDVQVLSFVGAGAELLDGRAGVELAREVNTRIAASVAAAPDRFAGFAHLPLRSPEQAASELEHAVRNLGLRGALVSGTTDGLFLDDARFTPVLEALSQLDVPLYLHPGIPPQVVRRAYYQGLPPATSGILSQAGYGWHAETAVHILRLALSGTLSRFPSLQVVVGHMGETLPFMMARIDTMFSHDAALDAPVSSVLRDHLWFTTSGMFTRGPLDLLLGVFGAGRTMFSIDYPFSELATGREFLDSLDLEDLEPGLLDRFAHGNADQLLGLGRP